MRGFGVGSGRASLGALLVLAACGGLSRSHESANDVSGGAGGTSGTSASGATSGSGGVSGGPALDGLLNECAAVCAKGARTGCRTNEMECQQSCDTATQILYQSAQCANDELVYLGCVGDLADICDVLDVTGAATPCDGDAGELSACIAMICPSHPELAGCGK